MKPDIHPEYALTTVTCSCGNSFQTRSTKADLHVEICAAQDEDADGEVQTELTRGQLFFAFGIAIGFAILLFKVSPALITNWLPIESTGAFVVVEGLVRVTIFIAYLLIISMLPDLKRVFQYHAAE